MERVGERRGKGRSEEDVSGAQRVFVGQGKGSGVYSCCNLKLLEGFCRIVPWHAGAGRRTSVGCSSSAANWDNHVCPVFMKTPGEM